MKRKLKHKLLPTGHTFHYGKRKYHVVQYFRDEQKDELLLILKYWNKYSQMWDYIVWRAWEYDWIFRKEELQRQYETQE